MTSNDAKIRTKFETARRELTSSLIEREDEVDMILTALIAGEHPLLVGPPGVAKSLLADSVMSWIDGNPFGVLLTKTTNPEELFGPLNIDAFVRDQRWERVTRGWLPEAHSCFLDEIWKSSSAILNTLLKILNEGVFQNNGQWTRVPLRLCIAASNEWPNLETGQELSALLDRFLFRKTVRPVATRAGEDRLYDFDGLRSAPSFSTKLTIAELDAARAAAKAIPYQDAAKDAFREIVAKLAAEGIRPGDRRRSRAVGAARAYAYLSGSDEVQVVHLECLANVLWDDPREQPVKAAEVVLGIANPDGRRVSQHLDEIEEILRKFRPSNLGSYAEADSQLQEIAGKLQAIGSNPKAVKALAYVRAEVKAIRLATVSAGI